MSSTSTATLLMDSPVGPLEVVSDGTSITHVLFVDDDLTLMPNALASAAPADPVLVGGVSPAACILRRRPR